MLPMALAVPIGRKPVLLVGFAVLPIRAQLYTFSNNAFWSIRAQLLYGIGAGFFGVITPLVIADLMHGTGRYNLAQGAVATVQGLVRIARLGARRDCGPYRICRGLPDVRSGGQGGTRGSVHSDTEDCDKGSS
jgi:hypothetical protein